MLRLANASDIDSLFSITDICYPDDPYDKDELRLVLRRNPTWVIDEKGKGITSCLISEINEGQPYIWSVSTLPTHRGKGLASLLLKEFEKHYSGKGYSRLWLHVRTDNPAQKLYFDEGYRVTSFATNIYGTGQHGLTMRKRIG